MSLRHDWNGIASITKYKAVIKQEQHKMWTGLIILNHHGHNPHSKLLLLQFISCYTLHFLLIHTQTFSFGQIHFTDHMSVFLL